VGEENVTEESGISNRQLSTTFIPPPTVNGTRVDFVQPDYFSVKVFRQQEFTKCHKNIELEIISVRMVRLPIS